METKRCTKCGEEKPATTDYFYRKNRLIPDLRSDCKRCANDATLARHQQWPEGYRRIARNLHALNRTFRSVAEERGLPPGRPGTLYRCPRCAQELPRTVEFFQRDSNATDGLCQYCAACNNARCKERRRALRPIA